MFRRMLDQLIGRRRQSNISVKRRRATAAHHDRKEDRRNFLRIEALEPRQLLAAEVWTDQLDYSPGQTAIISGSGFPVGGMIHLEVTRADGTPEGTPDNPWNIIDGVTDGGVGDLDGVADGNFTTQWYVNP